MRQTLLSVLALLIVFGLVGVGSSVKTRAVFTAFFRGVNADVSNRTTQETNDALFALVRRLNHQIVDLQYAVDALRLELDLPSRYGRTPETVVSEEEGADLLP